MKNSLLLHQKFLIASLFISANVLSQNVVTVTDCNLNGWVKDQRGNSTIMFINGPYTPPLGKGSFHFITPNQSFARLRNSEYSGTRLSAITEFSYSTFVEQRDSTVDVNFIVLLVDVNGDNTAEYNLVFDPRYQAQPFIKNYLPDQGKTQQGVWQNWDALHGGWFVGPDPKDDPDHGGLFFTLASFMTQNPNARIMNDAAKGGAAIRLTVGGPVFSKNFIGDADNFRIGVNGVTTIYDFEFTTANAGNDKNVIYGYGSNCVALGAIAAGGVAPYTYLWSPGGSAPNNANTEVCPTATTTYTLKVTDANGCSRTDDVMVFVNDVRCGNKMDKVFVCHHGEQICISPDGVPAHLNHGDVLGSCSQASGRIKTNKQAETIPHQFNLSNYPNPFRSTTKIVYELPFDGRVSIKIYDFTGREIATVVNEDKKPGTYRADFNSGNISGGGYYYKIIVSSATKVLSQMKKMIIVN
jgi:hypothetical protein